MANPLHIIWTDQRIAAAMAGGAVCLVIAVMFFILGHHAPDYALVLETGDDCRRYFDDTECRSIVAKAQVIHTDTAPRFTNLATCALVYGAGRCEVVSEHNVRLRQLTPGLAAIALSPARDVILPLYVGPLSEQASAERAGRTVYFNQKMVGRLAEAAMGGASLPTLNGPDGRPVTVEALRGLSHP
jgi:Protein of unknown function (DUF1190)